MNGVIYVSVNLWKERPGDKLLLAYVTRKAEALMRQHNAEGAVICITEMGSGPKSVRVRVIGLKASKQRWRKVTTHGVHNHMSVRNVRTKRGRIRTGTVHGLHKRTVGRAKQDAYFTSLNARVCRWTLRDRYWVIGGDFNRGHRRVAKDLGGTGRGKGVDGIIAGPGLRNKKLSVDRSGIKRGLTDHPIVFTLVRIKK